MNRYRQDVSEHFAQTSKLLRDLTLQYRNVYEHLAEGARTLCPEAGTLLPGSLAEAALPAEASPEEHPAPAAPAAEPARTNGAGPVTAAGGRGAGRGHGAARRPRPEPRSHGGRTQRLRNGRR